MGDHSLPRTRSSAQQPLVWTPGFPLKAALLQHPCRGRVHGEDVRSDLHQAELLEGDLTEPPDHGGHDPLAPEGLRQPVADLGPMRLAHLEAVETTAADQKVLGDADGEMDRTTVLLGGLGDDAEPLFGIFSVYG